MIIVFIIIYYLLLKNNSKFNLEDYKCNLDNFNIDNTYVIRRKPEYEKLIDKIINKKKIIFSDKEIEVLKNMNQIYKMKNDTGDDLQNISNKIYLNCFDDLDSENFELDEDANLEYDKIINEFTKKINDTIEPNCINTGVLKDKKYLENYYLDLYGNKVKSSLSDYFVNYYSTIDDINQKECIPVETLIGQSNFIIPDQYNIEKYFTNAYNIDWSRIINPNTWY